MVAFLKKDCGSNDKEQKYMKVRVSEAFSLVFGNWLLITCVFSLYWYWDSMSCPESAHGCATEALFYAVLSAFACIMPMLLWIIFTVYAVVSNKGTENKRMGALRFALVAMPCLLLSWGIAAFVTSYTILVVATLLCLVLIIIDILYVRALLLERKICYEKVR